MAIARRESAPRQLHPDGTPLLSPTADASPLQSNLPVHGLTLERLGLDVVHSLDDNLRYARMVYDERNLRPSVCTAKLGLILQFGNIEEE